MSDGRSASLRFVLAVLALIGCSALYVEIAIDRALPIVVPALLDRAVVPEAELRANLTLALRLVAIASPLVALFGAAFLAWLVLLLVRPALPFLRVLGVAVAASGWIAAGLVAKALLAWKTGQPDPPVNLGAFVRVEHPALRALVAWTNPFILLAIATMIRGLRAAGAPGRSAAAAGAAPWAAGAAGLAVLFGGSVSFDPEALVPTDGWPAITEGSVTLIYPPGPAEDLAQVTRLMDGFSRRLGERLSFTPAPLRVNVYADHAMLEQATGTRLHVQVTGSMRGADLLYLERPGSSAAMPRAKAIREALRYAGLVQLAPVIGDAPPWWVQGFVHAAVHPGNAALDREFRTILRNRGIPAFAAMQDPSFFRIPDGPLMARSLVDHVAFLHGPDTPERIMRDVIGGASFRDALFAHTRLTTTALEAGWRQALESLPESRRGEGPDSSSAPADTGRLDEPLPFLKGP